jgi:hypothetical protein
MKLVKLANRPETDKEPEKSVKYLSPLEVLSLSIKDLDKI